MCPAKPFVFTRLSRSLILQLHQIGEEICTLWAKSEQPPDQEPRDNLLPVQGLFSPSNRLNPSLNLETLSMAPQYSANSDESAAGPPQYESNYFGESSTPSSSAQHSSNDLYGSLATRGKGEYTCPRGASCTKGGVSQNGSLVVFERNSAFR